MRCSTSTYKCDSQVSRYFWTYSAMINLTDCDGLGGENGHLGLAKKWWKRSHVNTNNFYVMNF